MTIGGRCVAILMCWSGITGASLVARDAQVELDRILSRVNGRIVTQSDVRQARLLKLVDDVGSDAAIRRQLENRLLTLNEVSRAAALPPSTDAEMSARRQAWEAALGGANVASLLAQVAMNESDLESWLRDDVRIRAYMQRQFGAIAEPDRARAIEQWLSRLRQRAALD
ncbi:MAG: hypothetical protein ABI051_09345 [Vicinamibacterales bacterium]